MTKKREATVDRVLSSKAPDFFKPVHGRHNQAAGRAIFSVSLNPAAVRATARHFVGSARKVGLLNADIVVAVSSSQRKDFMDALREQGVIVYVIDVLCAGAVCVASVGGQNIPGDFHMLHYTLYQWWASLYQDPHAKVLVSPFDSVMFQSNPFDFHSKNWAYPAADLVVNLENAATAAAVVGQHSRTSQGS